MTGPETTMLGSSRRTVWLVALPLGVYVLALGALSWAVPWQPALDDREWLALAHHVADHGTLHPDGLFRRVPLWQWVLGAGVLALGERAAVVAVQGLCIAAVVSALALRARAGRASWEATLAVALAFVLSPQALLYSRHTANEPFVAALACGVLVVARRPGAGHAALAGAAAGAAVMTKLSAAVLLAPAAWLSWRSAAGAARGRRVVAVVAGFAAVALPLAALALAQRGLPLDDTSAFNLGALDQDAWLAAGGFDERRRLALASFREVWEAGPAAYLGGAGARALDWLMHPSSLDILAWVPGYPPLWVEAGDQLLFFGGLSLAVVGTSREDAPIWLLPLALCLACAFPLKTPYSPKVAALVPMLLLAPIGIDHLRGRS